MNEINKKNRLPAYKSEIIDLVNIHNNTIIELKRGPVTFISVRDPGKLSREIKEIIIGKKDE